MVLYGLLWSRGYIVPDEELGCWNWYEREKRIVISSTLHRKTK